MTTANESVIVTGEAYSCCSAPIAHAHHRDYPEEMAYVISAVMAAEHLAYQLSRSLDHAPDHQRREALEQALAEVAGLPGPSSSAPAAGGEEAEGESVMAISHAQPGQVIDVRPFGPALAGARTTALVKTESLEVIRLVIPRGKEIPTHTTRARSRSTAWRARSPSRPTASRTNWGPANCSTSRPTNPTPSWGSTTPRSS